MNIVGEDKVVQAYHWDCASAYNLRSMTYRREAIRDGITQAEATGNEELAVQAKKNGLSNKLLCLFVSCA